MNQLEEGINRYLEGDVNGAIKTLKEYALKYSNAQAYYYLGLAHVDIGKNDSAGVYFQKALDLEPDSGIYNYHLGVIYFEMMLFPQAINHLIKAIEINPEHVRAHLILGNVYFKNGELDNAASMYEKVIKISPHYAPAYYELGNSKYYKGDMTGAKEAYLKSVNLSETSETLYKLALIFIKEENYSLSMAYMLKAIEKDSLGITKLLNYISLLKNSSPESVSKFIQVIEKSDISPDDLETLKQELTK